MYLNNREKEAIINALSSGLPTLRKQLNLSQKDFADKLNLSRQTIVNIENNKCKMNWVTAFAILMFFALNPLTIMLLKPLGIVTDNLLKKLGFIDCLSVFTSIIKKK